MSLHSVKKNRKKSYSHIGLRDELSKKEGCSGRKSNNHNGLRGITSCARARDATLDIAGKLRGATGQSARHSNDDVAEHFTRGEMTLNVRSRRHALRPPD